MHIISIKMLREFWKKHPKAEKNLREWHTIVEHADFEDFHQVRSMFNSADYVAPYTIFDIGGNNYRLIVLIRYRFKKVYVHKIMTHHEYDEWNKRNRKSGR